MGSIDNMATQDKGMIHDSGEVEWDGAQFHHAAQNSVQFKMCEFLDFFLLNSLRLMLTVSK